MVWHHMKTKPNKANITVHSSWFIVNTRKGHLKKQSQFTEGQISVTIALPITYGDSDDFGHEKTKPIQSQSGKDSKGPDLKKQSQFFTVYISAKSLTAKTYGILSVKAGKKQSQFISVQCSALCVLQERI
jgi:hypothetical protein